MDLAAFVRSLPKAELHLHLEGALEPELMFLLARRNGVSLPYKSIEEVRRAYAFHDLQSFLDIYYAGAAVLQKREDFFELTHTYLARMKAEGVVHVEVFFDPQTHTSRGIAFSTCIEGILSALDAGRHEFGISAKLILCFLRHLPESEAFATLKTAEPYFEKLAGVGLDSSEVGHPPSKFARVFAAAREAGLRTVAHAGEEGPPAYVREALDLLKVDRIDHGNRAMEEDALVERLARENMTLTVCPLSNLKLCVVRDLKDHPLKRMLARGLRATVNSDDPAYFGGYMLANYVAVTQALGLSRADIIALARNSFLGSFLSDAEKAPHLSALDRIAAQA